MENARDSAAGPHRNELLRQAQARLLARPRISIQLRFLAALAVCFFMCCSFALDSLVLLDRVRGKLLLLGTLDEISTRVQEARLVEFDRSGGQQGLQEAQMSCFAAQTALTREAGNLSGEFSPAELSGLLARLDQYRGRLDEWASPPSPAHRSLPADTLRSEGADLSNKISAMIQRVRTSLLRTLSLTENVPLLLLAVILVLFTGVAYLHARALRDPIRRFQAYAERIAQADFGFIPPARSYRDEFTDLALAVNQMLADLQASQETCLRSAKLAAVGTITSGIAHELNNPLNNISLTTESLMENLKTLDDTQKWDRLQDIYFETERAGEIVKSLLDFTRIENPAMVPLDLPEVLRSTLRLVQNEFAINNIEVQLDAHPDLPKVRGALNQLRQVFLNLFINAAQAMPGGGTLFVTASHKEVGRACVDVRDTGAGIPPEVLPRIFDPFFTTKEPGSGTGLGLSVSYAIIMRHGGDIQVESEAGRGATFHVCLPTAGES